jgi:TRAP-type transport system periplasmic protein
MVSKFKTLLILVSLVVFVMSFSVSAAEFTLKWSSSSTPEYFFNRAARDTINEIEGKSNGAIEIEFYPHDALGKEEEVLEMVSLGTVDIAGMGAQFASNYSPKAGVTGIPFLIKDYEHMQRVLASGVFDEILDEIENKALVKVLGWNLSGIRHLTTKNTLVRTPEDLKGLKIRCMPSPFYQDAVASLGGTPTPVAYAELYMALQTGVVDGQENPVTAIWDSKMYEVQNYLMLTGHELYGGWLVVSQRSWEKLPEEYRNIIQQAFDEVYVPKCYEYFNEDENQVIAQLAKAGMNIIIPDQEAFRQHSTKYMSERYGEEWGDLIDTISSVK